MELMSRLILDGAQARLVDLTFIAVVLAVHLLAWARLSGVREHFVVTVLASTAIYEVFASAMKGPSSVLQVASTATAAVALSLVLTLATSRISNAVLQKIRA